MINLAELHAAQGSHARAVPWYEKALKIREIRWGEESEEAAVVRNNLALSLTRLAEYARAEKLYLVTLKFKEDIFDPESPEVALVHNNLGLLYQDKGDYRLAKTHLERALKIWEKSRGPNHPDAAIALGNLAAFYQGVGQPQRAEELARRVLKIREEQKDPNSQDLSTACNNLASILHDLGRTAEAIPLQRRSLALRERDLGPTHPNLANALTNYAFFLTEIGEWQESEQLLLRSLAIREKAGSGDLEIAHTLNNLGHLYDQQGRHQEAIKAYQRCLQLRRKKSGAKHADVAVSLNNLAAAYQNIENYAEAEKHYQQCLDMRRELLGANHPDVARVLGNLSTLSLEQNQIKKSLALCQQQLKINRDRLDEQHPSITQNRMALGSLLAFEEQWDSAHEHFDQVMRQRVAQVRQIFGVLAEAEQLRYLAMFLEADLSVTLSYAVHKRTDRRWRESSAAWVLNMQGLAHEALVERTLLARDMRSPKMAEMAADLVGIRKQLTALAFTDLPREKGKGPALAELLNKELRPVQAARGIQRSAQPVLGGTRRYPQGLAQGQRAGHAGEIPPTRSEAPVQLRQGPFPLRRLGDSSRGRGGNRAPGRRGHDREKCAGFAQSHGGCAEADSRRRGKGCGIAAEQAASSAGKPNLSPPGWSTR